MTKGGMARRAEGRRDRFAAERPTETPDTPESAALYAAVERAGALAPGARAALLADVVETAAAQLADLAMVSDDAAAAEAARRALVRIDREMGELLAAMAMRDD